MTVLTSDDVESYSPFCATLQSRRKIPFFRPSQPPTFTLLRPSNFLATSANMTSNLRPDREIIILFTVLPDTIKVAVHQSFLEESRNIVLMRRIAFVILTDASAELRFIHTGFAGLE